MESVVACNTPSFNGCDHETNVINTLWQHGIRSGVHHSMTVLDGTQWRTLSKVHDMFGSNSIPLRQRHALWDTLVSVHKATGIAHNQITPFVLYLHVDNIHTSIGGWDHALIQSTEREQRIDCDKITCYFRSNDLDSCFRNALDIYRTMFASRTRPLCSMDIAQDLSPADQAILEDYRCPLTKRVTIQPVRLWYRDNRRQNRRRQQRQWTMASRHVYELSAIRANGSTYYDHDDTQWFRVRDPVTGYDAMIGERLDRNVTSQVAYMLQHHSVHAIDDDDDDDTDGEPVTGGNVDNDTDDHSNGPQEHESHTRKRARSLPLVTALKRKRATTMSTSTESLRGLVENAGYRFQEMEAALIDARRRAIGNLDSIVKDLLDWIVPADMSTEQQTFLRAAIFHKYLANYPWGALTHWYVNDTNVDMFPYFEGMLDVSDPSILGLERIQDVGFPSTIRPHAIFFRTTTEANPLFIDLVDTEGNKTPLPEDSFMYADNPEVMMMGVEGTRNEKDVTAIHFSGVDRYIGKRETPPFPDDTGNTLVRNLPRWSWVTQLTVGYNFSTTWPIDEYLLPQLLLSKQTLFMSDTYDSMFLAFSKNLSTPTGHQLLFRGRLHTSLCRTFGLSSTDPYARMLEEKTDNEGIRPIKSAIRMYGNESINCIFSDRVRQLVHSGAFYLPRPRLNIIKKDPNDDGSYRNGTWFDLPAGPLRPLRGVQHEETPIFPFDEPTVKRIIFEGRKGAFPGLSVLQETYELLIAKDKEYKHFPHFETELKKLINSGENTPRFILIYLQLIFATSYDAERNQYTVSENHANYIIIDQENHVFFRYDPWGTMNEKGRDFLREERELESILQTILHRYQNVSYRMESLENHPGIQSVEGNRFFDCPYDIGGYCLMWTFFLLDFLANNADVDIDVRKIHQYIWNYFKDFGEAYELTQPEAALVYARQIKRIVEAAGKYERCYHMDEKCLCRDDCLKIMGMMTLFHY